jgi:hypothetical protein
MTQLTGFSEDFADEALFGRADAMSSPAEGISTPTSCRSILFFIAAPSLVVYKINFPSAVPLTSTFSEITHYS